MKIVIAGGSGFIGSAMCQYFSTKGYEVRVLTRHPRGPKDVQWDAQSIGCWAKVLADTQILINLTGKSVDCRYTESNKAEILRSRIDSTNVLNEAVSTVPNKINLWINASSATIYEHSVDRPNTEEQGVIGSDFSMDVVQAWEAAFFSVSIPNVRKVAMRISIVLGSTGGAFPKMKMIAKMGLGGQQGDGRQMVSWISIEDLLRATQHIIKDKHLTGPVNVTAPHPLKNTLFMKLLRQICRVPFGLPEPRWLLELGAFFMRTETELLLKSRFVLPEKLMGTGFQFDHEKLTDCLTHILHIERGST